MKATAPVGQRGGDRPVTAGSAGSTGMDRRRAPHHASAVRLGTPTAAVAATDSDPVRGQRKCVNGSRNRFKLIFYTIRNGIYWLATTKTQSIAHAPH